MSSDTRVETELRGMRLERQTPADTRQQTPDTQLLWTDKEYSDYSLLLVLASTTPSASLFDLCFSPAADRRLVSVVCPRPTPCVRHSASCVLRTATGGLERCSKPTQGLPSTSVVLTSDGCEMRQASSGTHRSVDVFMPTAIPVVLLPFPLDTSTSTPLQLHACALPHSKHNGDARRRPREGRVTLCSATCSTTPRAGAVALCTIRSKQPRV